jgi:hypothetical protein
MAHGNKALRECRRGHFLTPDNVIYKKNGTKECRECHKLAAHERLEKRKYRADGYHRKGRKKKKAEHIELFEVLLTGTGSSNVVDAAILAELRLNRY